MWLAVSLGANAANRLGLNPCPRAIWPHFEDNRVLSLQRSLARADRVAAAAHEPQIRKCAREAMLALGGTRQPKGDANAMQLMRCIGRRRLHVHVGE